MFRRFFLVALLTVTLGWDLSPVRPVQAAPAPSQLLPPETHQTEVPLPSEWWAENGYNQLSPDTVKTAAKLISNPYNTCGPTALAMLVSYYRASSPVLAGEPVTPAQVMKDVQKWGLYNPPNVSGTLGIEAMQFIARDFGLKPSDDQHSDVTISISRFLRLVRAGHPALAAIRYHYTPSGRYVPTTDGNGTINHFVIVYGSTQVEGHEMLWVINPHPSASLKANSDVVPEMIDVADFQGAWRLSRWERETGLAVFFAPSE